jgi:hypothetical protein
VAGFRSGGRSRSGEAGRERRRWGVDGAADCVEGAVVASASAAKVVQIWNLASREARRDRPSRNGQEDGCVQGPERGRRAHGTVELNFLWRVPVETLELQWCCAALASVDVRLFMARLGCLVELLCLPVRAAVSYSFCYTCISSTSGWPTAGRRALSAANSGRSVLS